MERWEWLCAPCHMLCVQRVSYAKTFLKYAKSELPFTGKRIFIALGFSLLCSTLF